MVDPARLNRLLTTLGTELAFLDAMGDAARFRNLLVHGYADVDDAQVIAILRSRPPDLHAYRRAIAVLE